MDVKTRLVLPRWPLDKNSIIYTTKMIVEIAKIKPEIGNVWQENGRSLHHPFVTLSRDQK
jgi:hypothetical protein